MMNLGTVLRKTACRMESTLYADTLPVEGTHDRAQSCAHCIFNLINTGYDARKDDRAETS